MDFLQTVGAFIAMLGIIVFVHEFGHFIVAKAFGMRVFIFSFGFGQRLAGFKWGDTDCRLSLIPLGGYVKLEGEPDDRVSDSGAPPDDDGAAAGSSPNDFTARPRWQRVAVYLAGPLMNAVLAIGVMTVLYSRGMPDASLAAPPLLGRVDVGSPAEAAGLRVGDEILSIDGRRTETWEGARYAILIRPGAEYRVRVRRDGQEHEVSVRAGAVVDDKVELGKLGVGPAVRVGSVVVDSPAAAAGLQVDDGLIALDGQAVGTFRDLLPLVQATKGRPMSLKVLRGDALLEVRVAAHLDPDGQYRIGIGQKVSLRKLPPPQALREATLWAWNQTGFTVDTLGRLVTLRLSPKTMSGPIGIARASGQAAKAGAFGFFFLLAIISLQVGLLNLLPVVPLDGGHLAILFLESVRRRDLGEPAKVWIMNTGFAMLMLLIVVVFYSDLSKTSLLGKYLP